MVVPAAMRLNGPIKFLQIISTILVDLCILLEFWGRTTMILELSVENLALIERADLRLTSGFTALTGETGAGKSLVIDALALALGGRADTDLVRNGEKKGCVTLLADLAQTSPARAKCQELGVDLDEDQLLIQREVSAEGRSTVRLNGRPSSVGILKQIGSALADLHGQHDHQSLLNPEEQIEFLDAWIGDEATSLKKVVSEKYSFLSSLQADLKAIRSGQKEREQRIDLLQFQIEEIAQANPQVGEAELHQAQLNKLKNAEKLGVASSQLVNTLGDEEGSAHERISTACRELELLAGLDSDLEVPLHHIRQAETLVQEATRALRSYSDLLEHNPIALEETANRLDVLARLKRKYGSDESEILAFLDEAIAELDSLQSLETDESSLESQIDITFQELVTAADELSDLRTQKSRLFQSEAQSHMRELAMDKAVFEVNLEKTTIQSNGQDTVEFQFSANPGEPTKPLHKVASGGELSRIMLAIKVASAGTAGIQTLIFDEVDTGLSGRAAAITARKLQQLAEHSQVVVISHLPQIAAAAKNHFNIEKVESFGRVITQIRRLDTQDRTTEIARLLAGEKIGHSALANAREIMETAADYQSGNKANAPAKSLV